MFETMQAEYQEQSILLASNIQNEFSHRAKRVDRSVKMAGFLVLRRTTMPSVLIETGFLSHPAERKFLLSKAGQNSLATAIYNAFNAYKKEIEQHSRFNLVTQNTKLELPENEIGNIENPEPPVPQVITTVTQKHTADTTAKPAAQNSNIRTIVADKNLYYLVQVMALKKKIKTTPENFRGETAVFSVTSTDFSRYFIGKFKTEREAEQERRRIIKKYPNAFIVAFRNNALISVKKAKEKE
jgi:N-acetylmuramoyl-L-alanine amidase